MAKVIRGETDLNKDDNKLPFAYYNPQLEGKLTWVCGEDMDDKITSVFCFDYGTHKDKKPSYLKDLEQAKYLRDELVKEGWKKIKNPEITFSMPGQKDGKPLNRKQKRFLQKKIKKMSKANPFKE